MSKETGNPLVSIIVRTKDRPKLLKKALLSAAGQTYRPIEVVLVNDGGCDLDVEELRSVLKDISLNYLKLEKNMGRALAGNKGIERAKGDYIGFLDDDDRLAPEHVATLVCFLEASDYKAAYGNSEIIKLSYDPDGNVFTELSEGIFSSDEFSVEKLLFQNYIPLISILFRSEVLRETGGFDDSFELFEDWELLIRAASVAPFYHIDKVTSFYIRWSKDYQIANVNWVKAKDYYLKVLAKHAERRTPEAVYQYYIDREETIHKREKTITGLRESIAQLSEVAGQVPETKEQGDPCYQDISDALRRELEEKEKYIEEIRSSLGWKILTFYRKKVKTFLVPPGTKMEKAYNFGLKGLQVAHRDGLDSLLKKAKNVGKRNLAKKRIKREKYEIPSISAEHERIIDAKVSVVIPTKNAGPDFKYTLMELRRQKGIREVEIIVVDSGSVDATVDTAAEYGARVYFVSPSEFNHGATRNLGAEKASGEFVVFMSQDVIPAGDFCMLRILDEICKDEKIAAASVRQVPRSDADLFSCWQLWYYNNKLLNLTSDRVTCLDGKDPKSLPVLERRRLFQLDNVFSCVRKSVFDKFRFTHLSYGEDLELGMRLLESGHKLLFLSSVGGIHSHNRPPAYFLKRSFVDTGSLLRLLDRAPAPWEDFGVKSTDDLLGYLNDFYWKIKATLHRGLVKDLKGYPLENVVDRIRGILLYVDGDRASHRIKGDRSLDELFDALMGTEKKYEGPVMKNDIFLNQFLEILDSFREYLIMSGTAISDERTLEFRDALYKIFAIVSGSNVGDYLYFSERMGDKGKNSALEHILGQSI